MLNACLIIKDDSECENLKGALDSIVPYVDSVYITATGNEVEQIKKLCVGNVHYSYFKWIDDFSAARNFNFSQVPPQTDYIFWMDADDRLVNGQYLREMADLGKRNGKDVIFLEYWYACRFKGKPSVENIDQVELTHQRERLIRPSSTKWVGRCHETPVPVDGARHSYTASANKPYAPEKGEFPVAVAHMAEDGAGLIVKMQRNTRLLKLQLKDERKRDVGADPRTLLYLMKIYTELDDPKIWQECLVMGQEYLEKSGWDEERGTCYELMGQVYVKMGELQKAKECFHLAIGQWPHNVLYYVRLATAYFNLKDYRSARHWMELGAQMDLDKRFTSGMINFHAIKALYAELMLKLTYNVDKDIDKAFEAGKMLYREVPTEDNLQQLNLLEDSKRLNAACRNFDELAKYLYDIQQDVAIVPMLDMLPAGISDQPFAQRLRQKFTPTRRWDDNEICYFANFNQPHFSKWDVSSLQTGIGGSETAVIKLANEWAKLGYYVTVYGDPLVKGVQSPESSMGKVRYLPYYYFNVKDNFNIFIQWRGWQLAEHIKCRKFMVDLHDIYSAVDISAKQLANVDKIMVKSKYQRDLAPTIPDDKFLTIGHGI